MASGLRTGNTFCYRRTDRQTDGQTDTRTHTQTAQAADLLRAQRCNTYSHTQTGQPGGGSAPDGRLRRKGERSNEIEGQGGPRPTLHHNHKTSGGSGGEGPVDH